MKKSILITIACLLLTIFLVSCTETPMQTSIGKSIDKNLNNLLYTVTKLDTIDNNTLANPDMYSAKNSLTFSLTPSPDSTIVRRSIAYYNPTDTNQVLKELIINKLIDKYKCDNNGNCYLCNKQYGDCADGTCDNCGGAIICDSNGNCKSCNKQLLLNDNGSCKNCNTNCVNGTCSSSIADRFNTNGNSVVLPNTSSNNSNNNCASNYRNPLETKTISNITTTDESDLTSAELKENNYDMEIIKPNSDTVYNSIENGYTSRYDKLGNRNNQSFRNAVRRSDDKKENELVVEQLSNETNLDNTTTTEQKPQTVYYYYEESFTPDALKYKPRFVSGYDQNTTENDFNNYIIKVQKLYAITSDVMEANNELSGYKTNLIDAIQSAKDLNKNFKELKYEPSSYQIQAVKNYLADLKATNSNLRACNGDLNDQINHISSNNTTISSSVDIMNSNYIALLNQLDARITFHRNALATLEQLSYIIQDAIVNNNPVILPNKDQTPIVEEKTENELPSDSSTTTPIEDVTTPVESTEIEDNNTIEETNSDLDNKPNTLLDTYKETPLKNVDTYKNINITENQTINNEVIENNTDENNNDIQNDTDNILNNENNTNNLDNNLIPDNNAVNDNIIPNNDINNGINNNFNNGVNNGVNNGINNNLNGNGRVNNRIISQNNLNQDNNVTNGSNYYYDANGSLYNANNFNGIEGKRNNNIDTYNYSTLIDTLNRGTVNNGINTLNITPATSEVIEDEENIDNNLETTNENIIENTDVISSEDEIILDENDEEQDNENNLSNEDLEINENNNEENNTERRVSISNKEENMQLESDELVDYTKELQDPEIKFLSDENL